MNATLLIDIAQEQFRRVGAVKPTIENLVWPLKASVVPFDFLSISIPLPFDFLA
jgi:hypothetical protein